MGENFYTDRSLQDESEDKFQRLGFSNRIAQTIIERKSEECIVYGIYGAWGEGKTTVLNFIQNELLKKYPEIITIKFNPWMFPDEKTLLINFFNKLAKEVKKGREDESLKNGKQKKRGWNRRKSNDLKTNTEILGDHFQSYGQIASIVGAGETIETIGKFLSKGDIEDLKNRLEEKLKNEGKKIVVIIDDIDRLDKNEIHAIFKLVKLTGDFPLVNYILSFDEKMVSKSLGERFGNGDEISGMNFIEKIVQIPIRLPQINKSALTNFCLTIIERSLEANKVILKDEEKKEFIEKFTPNFLSRLKTPRMAVRLGNALSFSIPLIYHEVNTIDLLLIEAVRVFYPELYDLIKQRPDFFIGPNFNEDTPQYSNEDKKFNDRIDECTQNYTPEEKEDCKRALITLFPTLKDVWPIGWKTKIDSEEYRYKSKRISSISYFYKYFTYSIYDGDVSDSLLESFVRNLSKEDDHKNIEDLKEIIKDADKGTLIEKLKSKEKEYDSNTSINLVKTLVKVSEYFPNNTNNFFIWSTPYFQLIILIVNLIKKQIHENERFDLITWIIENAKDFSFSFRIYEQSHNEEGEIEIFSEDQLYILDEIFIKKAIELSGDMPIWIDFPRESRYLLGVWNKVRRNDKVQNYIIRYTKNKIDYIIPLLKVYIAQVQSTGHPEPYGGDFEEQSYNLLEEVTNPHIIYDSIATILNLELKKIDTFNRLDSKQTDENLMKQFAYWHNKKIGIGLK